MSDVIELIVPNQAEYFLRNPALNLTGEMREQVIRFGGTYECEHSVFWSTAPRVLLLPSGYDPVWFADVHRALGVAPPPAVTPTRRSGLLVRDLLDDGAAQIALREHLSGHEVVRLTSTGPTPELYRLTAVIRGWGLTVEQDGVAEDDYWASLYLDSKMSCLDIARQLPGIRVAEGLTVATMPELRGAVDVLLARYGSVIARSLYGVAGDGSAVADTRPGSVERLFQAMARDSFFLSFPLIVQRFIPHATDVGCPAADILVGDDGVEEVVPCSLTVERGHLFRSVNVGQDALPAAWTKRLTEVSHELGEFAHGLGYRGWMCVDCVAGVDGELYVTEINARRSGSTHAGSLIRRWRPEQELTMSAHFMVDVPAGTTYENDIRPVFQRLWESGVRAFPTTVRGVAWPDPIVAVIAAAPTAAEAEEIVHGIKVDLNPTRSPVSVAG